MIGKTSWLIPDMYWPTEGTTGSYISHESICALNTSDFDANIAITLYYEDMEPITLQTVQCGARRTHHIRMDKILDLGGKNIPKGKPYAAVVRSDIPIVVQYSRLDTTQPEMSLMTTIAYPVD